MRTTGASPGDSPKEPWRVTLRVGWSSCPLVLEYLLRMRRAGASPGVLCPKLYLLMIWTTGASVGVSPRESWRVTWRVGWSWYSQALEYLLRMRWAGASPGVLFSKLYLLVIWTTGASSGRWPKDTWRVSRRVGWSSSLQAVDYLPRMRWAGASPGVLCSKLYLLMIRTTGASAW